jgi:hypothetical protein
MAETHDITVGVELEVEDKFVLLLWELDCIVELCGDIGEEVRDR